MMHFDESLPEDLRLVRSSSVKLRSEQLHELMIKSDDTALNYLFITNAGGAIFAFVYGQLLMGATVLPLLFKIALVLFFAGVVLVGLYKAYSIDYYEALFERYQVLIQQYYEQKIGWQEMNQADVDNAGDSKIPYVLGYGAFLSFIFGCVCIGIEIF